MKCLLPMIGFAWVGVFLGLPGSMGADWNQFRGPSRDGVIPSNDLPLKSLPAEPRIVWRQPSGDGFAAPVVVGGKVYCLGFRAGQETVYSLDATDGKRRWEVDLGPSHKDGFGTGPRCTPLVDNGLVFAQSTRGELAAMSVEEGTIRWRINYVRDLESVYIGEKGTAAGAARHGYNGSPVVDGTDLIAVAGGTNGASVVCLDKLKGTLRWKSQNDAASYSPPVVATIAGVRQVVAFTVQGIIGLDRKNGHLLWRVPLTTTFGRHVVAPIVSGNQVIVASHMVGTVAVRIVKDGVGLKAEEAWVNKEALINFSTPVAYRGVLYGLGPKSDLAAYDLMTGTQKWSQTGDIVTSADKSFAAFLRQDDRIVTLTDGGMLILYRANPDKYEELGRAQVCGANWCHPAYANGHLYVRDRKELLCINLAQ